jgi:hypothetical protein
MSLLDVVEISKNQFASVQKFKLRFPDNHHLMQRKSFVLPIFPVSNGVCLSRKTNRRAEQKICGIQTVSPLFIIPELSFTVTVKDNSGMMNRGERNEAPGPQATTQKKIPKTSKNRLHTRVLMQFTLGSTRFSPH